MKATIEIVHRDHTIKLNAFAADNNGGGFWEVAIEEPGGRCVHQDVEIMTSFAAVDDILSGLRCMVNELDDEGSSPRDENSESNITASMTQNRERDQNGKAKDN